MYKVKSSVLKRLIYSKQLTFFMEAHNALSAKIAEEKGFEALWASGLTISASMGLSDRNEATLTQVLSIVECMADHTEIPILMDGDTGFGNFNNVRRLIKKLEQIGVAGVVIEDKLFPKLNSFLGENQPLADIDEFCGKIKAAKDTQIDSNFCVIARIEAFISGKGLKEALKRAQCYFDAGADAVLIHSKKQDATEILEFAKAWGLLCPIFVVPTTYYETPKNVFLEAGISNIIWANHSLRAAITAIKDITEIIKKQESVASINNRIASLKELFALTTEPEVELAEKKYLPKIFDKNKK